MASNNDKYFLIIIKRTSTTRLDKDNGSQRQQTTWRTLTAIESNVVFKGYLHSLKSCLPF